MAVANYAIGEILTTVAGGANDSTAIAPYDLLVADSKTPTGISQVVITHEAQTDPDPDYENVMVHGLVSDNVQIAAGWASSIIGDEVGLDYYMGIELPSTMVGLNVADGPETVTITPGDPTDLLGTAGAGYGITVELQLLTQGSEPATSGSVEVTSVEITYAEAATPAATGECPPTALWTPNLALGKLEWLDESFTIPNYMIRWEGRGDSSLGIATLSGEDDEVVDGIISRRKIERTRRANLECQMNFWSDASGTLYDTRTAGDRTNWATLNALATSSKVGDGLQSFRWTPYDGATPIDFDARMMPPVKGSVGSDGHGRSVGIILEVADPSGLP